MSLDQALLAEKYTNDENLYLYGRRIFSVQTEIAYWRKAHDIHDFMVNHVPSTEGNRWWVPREVVQELMARDLLHGCEQTLTEEFMKEWTFFYEFY